MILVLIICGSRWWKNIDNCEAAGVVTIFSASHNGPAPLAFLDC